MANNLHKLLLGAAIAALVGALLGRGNQAGIDLENGDLVG